MSVGVVLNYVIPARVFGWLMSFLSFDVAVIWAMIVLTPCGSGARWPRANAVAFRMPYASVTSWICLVFVAFVFVMLGVDPTTRGSLRRRGGDGADGDHLPAFAAPAGGCAVDACRAIVERV